jgi:hypothetical protein
VTQAPGPPFAVYCDSSAFLFFLKTAIFAQQYFNGMGLIKLALFLLLIYLLVKLFTRYLLPYILKRFIRKTEERYKQQRKAYEDQNKQEGDIRIEYQNKKQRSKKTDNLGEYVDYEEIDDEEKDNK